MESLASFSRFSDVPPGAYILTGKDPVTTERLVMSLAGSALFGLAGSNSDTGSKTGETKAFLWGPDAAFYFCFDNIYDEVAVGLRSQYEEENSIPGRIRTLLNLVGLERFEAVASMISPMQLSGGEQQRLLTAILLSRRVSCVVGMNPLIYVDHRSRQTLLDLVARAILERGGKIVIASEDAGLPAGIFTKSLMIADERYTVLPITEANNVGNKRKRTVEVALISRSYDTTDSAPLFQIENATWRYASGKIGIRVAFLKLTAAKIYIVCGPNGGGKSSLMRLIIAKQKLSSTSTMVFKGQRVVNPFRDLVKKGHLSFSFQDPNIHMTGDTVEEYLRFAKVDKTIIARLQIADYLNDDLLSVPFWVRQAVVFSAAVCADSALTVLDEPLDGIAYEIFGAEAASILVEKANEGRTVLLVTHNPLLAMRLSSRFVWISNGAIQVVNKNDPNAQIISELDDWLGATPIVTAGNN
jgi:Fe-S cluster assembly ATP-binding protein